MDTQPGLLPRDPSVPSTPLTTLAERCQSLSTNFQALLQRDLSNDADSSLFAKTQLRDVASQLEDLHFRFKIWISDIGGIDSGILSENDELTSSTSYSVIVTSFDRIGNQLTSVRSTIKMEMEKMSSWSLSKTQLARTDPGFQSTQAFDRIRDSCDIIKSSLRNLTDIVVPLQMLHTIQSSEGPFVEFQNHLTSIRRRVEAEQGQKLIEGDSSPPVSAGNKENTERRLSWHASFPRHKDLLIHSENGLSPSTDEHLSNYQARSASDKGSTRRRSSWLRSSSSQMDLENYSKDRFTLSGNESHSTMCNSSDGTSRIEGAGIVDVGSISGHESRFTKDATDSFSSQSDSLSISGDRTPMNPKLSLQSHDRRMISTQQTLRLAGLPSKTKQSDVMHFFTERFNRKRGRQIVESVGPICGHPSRSTKHTTVSFSSYKTAQKALNLGEVSRRMIAENGGAETITLDASFLDLTTLHSSINPATGKPDIDIVALHGLTGHGWNSFATSSSVEKIAGRTKETNWLRDILPRLLEQNWQGHIHPRVMTYGYDADVWMTRNVADIDVPVHNLLIYLDTERREDPERPLYFIGHSLGGIVIKQAIVALADETMLKNMQEPQGSTKQYNFPVKGCMFFGVPNRGADTAGTASSILTLLSSVFNVNKNVVRDLESKSQQLANFTSEFRQIRKEHNILVISFFETVKYSYALGLIVDKDSAVIEYPGSPRPFGIHRNHKEMARFSGDETHALEPAIDFLAQFARNAVNARQHSHLSVSQTAPYVNPSNLEDKYSTLESYDTVFLVDDSPSMAGERWDLVKKILDYSTTVAMLYDPDGIDVHFLNNKTANRNNIKDPAIAVEVHQNIVLKGSTPILDQLSRHLKSYVQMFNSRRAEEINFKGYNLIVLTDGEPNPEYEDPDEISDPEDARKYSAAYRRIRKTIVGVARALDKAGAERTQVGIQFCQIGNDDGAHNFFKYLDNQLKGKYKLGRDMIDTIHCSSEADLTQTFFYKLLLGALDQISDCNESSKDSSKIERQRWLPEDLPRLTTDNLQSNDDFADSSTQGGYTASHKGSLSAATTPIVQSGLSDQSSDKAARPQEKDLPMLYRRSVAPSRQGDKKLQCTWCNRGYRYRSDWVRHLETHDPQQKWICMHKGPRLVNKGNVTCAFCGESNPGDEHFNTEHHALLCFHKPEQYRTFPRRNSLFRHMKYSHQALIQTPPASWRVPVHENDTQQFWCGFCEKHLWTTWESRLEHMENHFVGDDIDMTRWRLEGGLVDDLLEASTTANTYFTLDELEAWLATVW